MRVVGRSLIGEVRKRRSAAYIAKSNTRRAYERLYRSDRLLASYLSRERLQFYAKVAEECAAFMPRSVIDVGCGSGDLLVELSGRMRGRETEFTGIDHAESGIARARAKLPKWRFFVADLYELEPVLRGERFDLVLCSEVLEHLVAPERALDVLVLLRGPRGRIVITVPDGSIDDWEGHVNFWSESSLKAFLEPAGSVAVHRIGERTLLAIVSETNSDQSSSERLPSRAGVKRRNGGTRERGSGGAC